VNTGQRIAILVAAVVVLAGGFVLARGSDDEGGSEQTLAPAETVAGDGTETSEGTGGAEAPSGSTTQADTQTQTQEQAPAPRVETVRIRGGKPASGEARTLRFDSGDTIRLRFTSDAAAEVHIHGYDRTVEVPAGGSASTRFKGDAEGIFEVEDHHSGAVLAKLEVRP
jgi:hypothetical protein